jgi:4'-phosphopantetheinyl transferase
MMSAQGEAVSLPGKIECEFIFVDILRTSSILEAEESATPRLSSIERDRFMSRAATDRRAAETWRSSRIALRIALERWAGSDVRQSAFEIERGGRPHLTQGWPHFSMSHTGDVAFIAISNHSAIGVDIEQSRTLNMSEERRMKLISAATKLISSRVPAHAPHVENLDDHSVLQAWVQLEAVAKATGLGIGRVLTDLGVSGGENNDELRTKPYMADRLCVKAVDVGLGYFAATAAEALPETLHVSHFPYTHSNLAMFSQSKPPCDQA